MTFREALEKVRAKNHKIELRVVSPPFSFVRVSVKDGRRRWYGNGFFKCNPTDEWSDALASSIPMGRAEADIARQMVEFTEWRGKKAETNRQLVEE